MAVRAADIEWKREDDSFLSPLPVPIPLIGRSLPIRVERERREPTAAQLEALHGSCGCRPSGLRSSPTPLPWTAGIRAWSSRSMSNGRRSGCGSGAGCGVMSRGKRCLSRRTGGRGTGMRFSTPSVRGTWNTAWSCSFRMGAYFGSGGKRACPPTRSGTCTSSTSSAEPDGMLSTPDPRGSSGGRGDRRVNRAGHQAAGGRRVKARRTKRCN